MKEEIKINGIVAAEGKDYRLDGKILYILNESLLPIRTIEYSVPPPEITLISDKENI